MTISIRTLVKNWGFWLQKSSKFEENSKINIYSLVPQIDHPVALCNVQLTRTRKMVLLEFIEIIWLVIIIVQGYHSNQVFHTANQPMVHKFSRLKNKEMLYSNGQKNWHNLSTVFKYCCSNNRSAVKKLLIGAMPILYWCDTKTKTSCTKKVKRQSCSIYWINCRQNKCVLKFPPPILLQQCHIFLRLFSWKWTEEVMA